MLLNLDCNIISAVYIVHNSEEAESEELAPVNEDHDHSDTDRKDSAQEELGAVVEGEAVISPEEAPVEEDNPVIVTPQEDRVADDTNGAASQDSDIQEPLASDPQEATEVDTVTVEAAEASPDETPEETIESIFAENQEQISDIPLEASDDKSEHKNAEKAVVPEETLIDPAGNTEIEESLNLTPEEDKPLVLVPEEDETEEASQEEPASQESVVELTDQAFNQEDEEESDPILLSNTEEEDTSEAIVESVDVVEATGVPSVEQQSPPSTLEQDETDVLFSLELPLEPAEDEMEAKEPATEDPAVIAVSDNSEEEPVLEEQGQREPVPDPDASEEHTEENTAPNLPNNGEYVPSTVEEDDTVVLIFDMDEESQEDPAVVVINSSEEELELEKQVQEEIIPSVSPEISDNSEERTEIDTEENTTQNSPDYGKHFPGASEENTTAAGTTTEEPSIILVEPINEEPAPEEPLLIIVLAEGEEDSQGDSSKGATQSDLHPEEAVLAERTAPLDEAGDSGADKLVTSGTETTEEVLEPGEVHVGKHLTLSHLPSLLSLMQRQNPKPNELLCNISMAFTQLELQFYG